MSVRQIPVVVSVAAGLLLSGSALAASSVRLDGVKSTSVHYTAALSTSTYQNTGSDVQATPKRTDCTKTSCDMTPLLLLAPRGRSSGQFDLLVTYPDTVMGTTILYDATGAEVKNANDPRPVPQPNGPNWEQTYSLKRLPVGAYTLVVYDLGGLGTVSVDITWKANPPDRQKAHS